jgi:hypothetical protein
MYYRTLFIVLISSLAAWAASSNSCGPASEIRSELQKAAAAPITDPTDFDRNVAPFLTLRERYPNDLFVHERYQDAVGQHGIEGHMRALAQEYQTLAEQHPGDLVYRYLNARSLLGRSTPSTIQGMNDIIAANPKFAPAHRTLAEIYGSEAFRDARKEKVERGKLLALCPGATLVKRPDPLPDQSPLIDRAERLFNMNSIDLEPIVAMALQGIRDDEWRLQRIRPFDWYNTYYKRQSQREIQARYWRVWSLQVRCYRKMGQSKKADDLLALMDQRANLLRKDKDTDHAYWDALAILATLYAEANQQKQATDKLKEMEQLLAEHPDPARAAALDILRKQVWVLVCNPKCA